MRRHIISYFINKCMRKKSAVIDNLPFEPESICVELTNRCNYSCEICPQSKSRLQKIDMDFEFFKKIIDNIEAWNPERKSIALYVFGEPFLYNKIFDCFDYIKNKLKKCKIYISTNFSVVDKKFILRLFKPKNYNLNLKICIDSLSPKTYKKQRGSNDYYKVFNNINYLIELKRRYNSEKPELNIGMIVTKYNKGEERQFIKFWKERIKGLKGAQVYAAASHDWAKQISPNNVLFHARKIFGYKHICKLPFSLMTIFSNGDVSLCCLDINHNINIGNAKQEDLKTLWNGPKAAIFRKAMKLLELDSFVLCKNCWNYNMPIFFTLSRGVSGFFRRRFHGTFLKDRIRYDDMQQRYDKEYR